MRNRSCQPVGEAGRLDVRRPVVVRVHARADVVALGPRLLDAGERGRHVERAARADDVLDVDRRARLLGDLDDLVEGLRVGADRRVAAVEEARDPELLGHRRPWPASPRRWCPGRTPAPCRCRSSPGRAPPGPCRRAARSGRPTAPRSTASPSSLYRIHGSSNAPPKLTRQLSRERVEEVGRVRR